MAFSSPNRFVWIHYQILRRLIHELPDVAAEEIQKQQIVLVMMVGVSVVEVFINIYFRVLVDQAGFEQHLSRIEKDLKRRKSLDQKLKEWPTLCFGRGINWKSGSGKDFMLLKERRNSLMHFVSSHTTLPFDDFKIAGAADTSVFDDLNLADAEFTLSAVEGLLTEVFRLRGVKEDNLARYMQFWTSKISN